MEIVVHNRHDIKGMEVKTYGPDRPRNKEDESERPYRFADLRLDLGDGNAIVITFDEKDLGELMANWQDALETITQWLC